MKPDQPVTVLVGRQVAVSAMTMFVAPAADAVINQVLADRRRPVPDPRNRFCADQCSEHDRRIGADRFQTHSDSLSTTPLSGIHCIDTFRTRLVASSRA